MNKGKTGAKNARPGGARDTKELIDTSVFCGYWPFRALRYRSAPALKEHLQKNGVTQAWVSATEAILYPDPMEANEPLFQEIRGDAFFLPVAILNPTLASWRDDVKTCIEKWGCRMFKLLPNYHQYELMAPEVDEFVQFAIENKTPICVQLFMMDMRAQHPLLIVQGVPAGSVATIAKRYPDVRFLLCGAMSGAAGPISDVPNIWMETSLVESDQALKNVADRMDPKRLVFGSHSPFQYFKAMKAKLQVDPRDVKPEIVDSIKAANARAFLNGAVRKKAENI
jgi:predicted TIM-barrel fold metal-dependent hydrolase